MAWRFGATEIREPTTFNIAPIAHHRTRRTEDGTLAIDKIATKKVFNLSYTGINLEDLQSLAAYEETKQPFTFTYFDRGVMGSATVRMRPINRSMIIQGTSPLPVSGLLGYGVLGYFYLGQETPLDDLYSKYDELWDGVTIQLEET